MSLIVQKFGGSSLANAEKLLHAANIVKTTYDAGHDVVAVVSAQGDATDELLQKAAELSPAPAPRELDALLATGEQASAALMATALLALGVPAVSLSAWQVPIRTGGGHGDARVERIETERIAAELQRRRVVVVTGFQGVGGDGDLTTLGRGGSDTSAVALAAALRAALCQIYTDVDGVYSADPRLCPAARRLERISCDDMLALAAHGAQVLHDRSVALARESGVALEVRSCGPDSAGTRVGGETGRGVAGVTLRAGEDAGLAELTAVGAALPSLAHEKRAILALAAADIEVRAVGASDRCLTLFVARERSREALCVLHDALLGAAETA